MDSTDDSDGEISDLGGDELKESLGLQSQSKVVRLGKGVVGRHRLSRP